MGLRHRQRTDARRRVWTQSLVESPWPCAEVAAALHRLGYLVNWKSGFGALSIALLMFYIALYANHIYGFVPISHWAAGWLHWLYGANAKALLASPPHADAS